MKKTNDFERFSNCPGSCLKQTKEHCRASEDLPKTISGCPRTCPRASRGPPEHPWETPENVPRTPGGPLEEFRSIPNCSKSHMKIIEKPLLFPLF